MISAAEAQLVGWPLPAWVVERTESMRRRVALSRRTLRAVCAMGSAIMEGLPGDIVGQRAGGGCEEGYGGEWSRMIAAEAPRRRGKAKQGTGRATGVGQCGG